MPNETKKLMYDAPAADTVELEMEMNCMSGGSGENSDPGQGLY